MADPLILSPQAARRLRLLVAHGAQLPPGLHAAAAAAAAQTAGRPAPSPLPCLTGHGGALPAALLAEPVPVHGAVVGNSAQPTPGGGNACRSGGSSWHHERDVMSEVAVTLRTLQMLKLSSGCMVVVTNEGRPEVPPHLARLLALPEFICNGSSSSAATSSMADGVAYLAPSLAYNLGLGLHLRPLLHGGNESTDDNGGHSSSSSSLNSGLDRVLIRRFASSPSQQQQERQQELHRLPQPGSEAAAVPVAAEVHISVVRMPAVAVLQQPRAKSLPGGGNVSQDAEAPADGSSGGGQEGNATAGSNNAARRGAAASQPSATASDNAVAALQQWLLAACRVVQEGDVLAVPRRSPGSSGAGNSSQLLPQVLPNLHDVPQPLAAQQVVAAAAAAPLELLYFKVAKLVLAGDQQAPPGVGAPCTAAAVDEGSTAVKLVGSCSSSLPVGLPQYLAAASAPPMSSNGSSMQQASSSSILGAHAAAAAASHPLLPPAGLLLPAWRQLAELLASVLHPAALGLPLRLALLVHGPAGSGKRTAAAAAATAVGCHLVSLSCHDVKAVAGAVERHTFEGLRTAFAAAADYAPAVLLLRHLSVLGDGSSHGGSGSSSTQSYAARLGSVLADCIRTHSGGGSGTGQPQLFPSPVVLVACTASAEELPPALRRCFTHELALEAPDQRQRQQLLHNSLAGVAAGPDWLPQGAPAAWQAAMAGAAASNGVVPAGPERAAAVSSEGLEDAARHTAGLLPRELRAVAADAAAAAALQVLPPASVLAAAGRAPANENGVAADPALEQAAAPAAPTAPLLSQRHLAAAIEAVRQRTATDIGAPRIPSVKWEDVGGLHDIKRAILDTVELPLKHPELFAGGLRRRSGVLLYGPPGTGKTLLAKAVATECSISFLSVKGPELINMYVGESERQIREVFARARRARPCVVFFDELDSLAPARGRGSDSGGVMDRVVSQLLAEIDGVQGAGGSGDVFLVGATNRPDLLDPALLRPGRLDKLLYVGIASDVPSRLQVLQALTRKFTLGAGLDLAAVAACCGDRFTGADLYALCSDAWMTALKRCIARLEQEEQQQQPAAAAGDDGGGRSSGEAESGAPDGGDVVVTQADFLEAAANLQPSLSADEVARYEQIRDQYNSQTRGSGK